LAKLGLEGVRQWGHRSHGYLEEVLRANDSAAYGGVYNRLADTKRQRCPDPGSSGTNVARVAHYGALNGPRALIVEVPSNACRELRIGANEITFYEYDRRMHDIPRSDSVEMLGTPLMLRKFDQVSTGQYN